MHMKSYFSLDRLLAHYSETACGYIGCAPHVVRRAPTYHERVLMQVKLLIN